jgi:hypothetical protein
MIFSVVLKAEPSGGAHHVESGTPWKGYFQPQSKSILAVKVASGSPRARRLRIFATKRNPNR